MNDEHENAPRGFVGEFWGQMRNQYHEKEVYIKYKIRYESWQNILLYRSDSISNNQCNHLQKQHGQGLSPHLSVYTCAARSCSVGWWGYGRVPCCRKLRWCTDTPSEPVSVLHADRRTQVRFIHWYCISWSLWHTNSSQLTLRNGAAVMVWGICMGASCSHLTAGCLLAFTLLLKFMQVSFKAERKQTFMSLHKKCLCHNIY